MRGDGWMKGLKKEGRKMMDAKSKVMEEYRRKNKEEKRVRGCVAS